MARRHQVVSDLVQIWFERSVRQRTRGEFPPRDQLDAAWTLSNPPCQRLLALNPMPSSLRRWSQRVGRRMRCYYVRAGTELRYGAQNVGSALARTHLWPPTRVIVHSEQP